MSRLLCSCCTSGEEDERKKARENDYLLPGGEWDPSLSSSPSSRGSVRVLDRTDSERSDSSRTTNTSRGGSIRSFLTRRFGRGFSRSRSQASAASVENLSSGDYQPPPLVPSRTLPTMDEFKLLKTVGRGAFGKVMLAVHNETRILYALKVVPKAKITTQKQVEQILAESRILKSIRHPFCVALQYAFQNDDFLFYVFEFAAGGMLFYHLRKDGRFSEPRARFYFGEIVLALDYLHSFGIIFRDLKPENCMLAERGHILLTDFGSAKRLEMSQKTSTIAGTPQYIAPEVLRGEPYSFSADWWSCGVLLYEMLTGKTPFYSGDRVELYKMVLRGYFSVPKSVSPRARALIHKLINKSPSKRMGCSCGSCQFHSAADIKQHNFFSQSPLDPEEESRYAMEDAEREWEREALESQRRSRSSSLFNAAGNLMRSVSISARRVSMLSATPYQGVACEWSWEKLEAREVVPPFKPKLSGPTDLRHFDPTLTCIPPTLSDLITTERSLHVENFDHVAPEDLNTVEKKYPNSNLPGDMEHSTTVEVTGGGGEGEGGVGREEEGARQQNTTDEEKVFIQNKVNGSAESVPALSVPGLGAAGRGVGSEGQFVEGKLDRSVAPLASTEVLVTAEVNPQS